MNELFTQNVKMLEIFVVVVVVVWSVWSVWSLFYLFLVFFHFPAFQVLSNLFPREVSMIDSSKEYILPSLFIQKRLIPRCVTLSLKSLNLFTFFWCGREGRESERGERIKNNSRRKAIVNGLSFFSLSSGVVFFLAHWGYIV